MEYTYLKIPILALLTIFCSCETAKMHNVDSDTNQSKNCDKDTFRCSNNMLQKCVEKTWTDWSNCEDVDELCSIQDGTSQCLPSNSNSDSNSSTDSGSTSDPDSDSISISDSDYYIVLDSFLWVANSLDGTVSKIDTRNVEEVARYKTCNPNEENSYCDPSRTAVNLHGDAVVTNRHPNPTANYPSSVTKIVSIVSECKDENGDGKITTSSGPTDVLPWGEDDCVAWHTALKDGDGGRATVWDGQTDLWTGEGGSVLVGTCRTGDTGNESDNVINDIYVLNGDNGEISKTITDSNESECYYSAAMDAIGTAWIMEGFGYPNRMLKIDMSSSSQPIESEAGIQCGYGIAIDQMGRVWTSGKKRGASGVVSCLQRVDPYAIDGTKSTLSADIDGEFLRGLAVGSQISEGFIWSVETHGKLYKFDNDTLEVVATYQIRGLVDNTDDNGLVGVAVDVDGYVWCISPQDNAVYRFDPSTEEILKIEVGRYPYTYSDMTRKHLKAAAPLY